MEQPATSIQRRERKPASKRMPRSDQFRGVIYDDWFEQQKEELTYETETEGRAEV